MTAADPLLLQPARLSCTLHDPWFMWRCEVLRAVSSCFRVRHMCRSDASLKTWSPPNFSLGHATCLPNLRDVVHFSKPCFLTGWCCWPVLLKVGSCSGRSPRHTTAPGNTAKSLCRSSCGGSWSCLLVRVLKRVCSPTTGATKTQLRNLAPPKPSVDMSMRPALAWRNHLAAAAPATRSAGVRGKQCCPLGRLGFSTAALP